MRPTTTTAATPWRPGRTALACLSATLLVAACGTSENSDPNTVVYWDTSTPQEHAVFTELAQDCGNRGGYRVEVQAVAWDQARNNYKTAAQGGQGPDVLRADVTWVAELAHAGLIQDLSGTPLADTSGFLREPVESTRYRGKPYGVPQVTDTLALFYNKRELARAGAAPPRTWEEVKRVADKLGDKALFLNNDVFYALPLIYSQGGDLVDARRGTIEVNSPGTVRGLRIAKDLVDSGAARTALDATNSYGTMKTAFSSGEVAMMLDGPWVTPELSHSAEFADRSNLGIAEVPGGSSPIGGHDYVLRQGSESTAAARKFVQCMSSARTQAATATRLGLLPTREFVYRNPAVRRHPVVSAFAPLVARAHGQPWIPQGEELIEPMKTAYADILTGTTDAQRAADEVARTYKETVVPEYTER